MRTADAAARRNDRPLVAHVVFRFDYGGLENGIVNLVNGLPERRYRHAIVCLRGYGEKFRERLRREDVVVTSVDKQPGKDLACYGRLWRALRELRPALVHTRNLGTLDMQWAAAAAGVRRRVHGEHGWDAADPRGLSPRSLRLRRACDPVVQEYVAMSRDIAAWLEATVRVRHDKVRQIYNGVDTVRFRPRDPSGEPRAKSEFVIGTVGRLDPVKNQSALIGAFADLAGRRPQLRSKLRLRIAGEGPIRGQLQQAASDRGVADRVEFVGACDDVPGFMRSLDVFVLPSINEGISNTILEAMATGLPVVAARVGGNPELVVDGLTGALCSGSDAAAIADRLLPYIDDPALRQAHGAAARARVEKEFSLSRMIDAYDAFYTEALSK